MTWSFQYYTLLFKKHSKILIIMAWKNLKAIKGWVNDGIVIQLSLSYCRVMCYGILSRICIDELNIESSSHYHMKKIYYKPLDVLYCLPWTIQYKCHFYHLHLTNFLQHFEGWCTWFKCVFHGWEWTFEYKLHLLPFFILCLLGHHGFVGDQMLNIQLHRPQPSYDSIRVEFIPVSMTVIGQIQSIKALIGLSRLKHPQISDSFWLLNTQYHCDKPNQFFLLFR